MDAMTDCLRNAGYEAKVSYEVEGSSPWFRVKCCTFFDLNAWLLYHLKYGYIHGQRYPQAKVWHQALRAANARSTRWHTQVIRIPGYRATEYTLDLLTVKKKLTASKVTHNPSSQPMSSQPSASAIRAATLLACAPAEESSSEDDATSDGSYEEETTVIYIGESDFYHESRRV